MKLSKINFKLLPLSIPILLLCCYTIRVCLCFVGTWWPPFYFGQKSLLGGESEQNMLFIKHITCLCILVELMAQIKWSFAQNTIGGNTTRKRVDKPQ
jgi:hypothetical protein